MILSSFFSDFYVSLIAWAIWFNAFRISDWLLISYVCNNWFFTAFRNSFDEADFVPSFSAFLFLIWSLIWAIAHDITSVNLRVMIFADIEVFEWYDKFEWFYDILNDLDDIFIDFINILLILLIFLCLLTE